MKKMYAGDGISKPKVAIIVIGYNEEKILGKCFDSVLAAARIFKQKTGENIEILYVDSFSTDNSVHIAQEKGVRVAFAPKRFHTCTNGSMTGILLTDSEYVMLVDGDMELDLNWVVEGAAYLDAHHFSAGVSGLRDDMRATKDGFKLIKNYYGNTKEVEPVDKNVGGAFLLRRKALDSISGLESGLALDEDYFMFCQLKSRGQCLFRINKPMIMHWDFKLNSIKEALIRLLINKNIAITGVILRHALFHEHWAITYLWNFKRDLMLHGIWFSIIVLCTSEILQGSGGKILWQAFGLVSTLSYGLTVWRSKRDWPRTAAAFLLRTVYLLYMVGGIIFNRPKVEFGVQSTSEYRREVYALNSGGERI